MKLEKTYIVNKRHFIVFSGLLIIATIVDYRLNLSAKCKIHGEAIYKEMKIFSGLKSSFITNSTGREEDNLKKLSQESFFLPEIRRLLSGNSDKTGKYTTARQALLKRGNLYQYVLISESGYSILDIVIPCLAIILLYSLLCLYLYKIRLKKIYSELSYKEKIISEVKKEYQATLSQIQKINSDLIAAKEKAEVADKLKTAFLTNMSHEIRTPMNAIIGLLSFLTEPGLSKEKAQEFIEIINSSSQQLLTIIDDIVDISKIEAGEINIVTELVNINKLLDEIHVMYSKVVELRKSGLIILCKKTDNLIQTTTDRNRVKQVLCNLLNNALKFTEEGEIEFGYKLKEKFIEFYVKDNGIGIAPENITLIFDRFRQVGSLFSRTYGGLGVGLSISKGLVEKMGGTIWCDSELGKGSTFYFTIPYIQDHDLSSIHSEPIKSQPYTNWENKTILIVEDDINNYIYIEKILLPTNIKIIHAWNGREAVELLKNHSEVCLVLMDFKMPVMDGYKATQLIKELRPRLPIIAQTAYAFTDDKAKAFSVGCDDYLSKPFQRDTIIEIMGKYLEKQA